MYLTAATAIRITSRFDITGYRMDRTDTKKSLRKEDFVTGSTFSRISLSFSTLGGKMTDESKCLFVTQSATRIGVAGLAGLVGLVG